MKKGVLKNLTKFTGKHLCQSLNFIKKETLAQVFSYEFSEISKNTFFTEHLWTTASNVGIHFHFHLCTRAQLYTSFFIALKLKIFL